MLFETLLMLLDPVIIFSIFAGVSAGLFVGAMPGLTATMALAVLLPFTFTLPPLHGLVALGAVVARVAARGDTTPLSVRDLEVPRRLRARPR